MNQSELRLLMTGLRCKLSPRPRRIGNDEGYRGHLVEARTSVAKLVADERLHVHENRAYVTRLYTERLISDAILHGDRHEHTFEMAKWWLQDDLGCIEKLFKVLVPRFRNYTGPYTRIFNTTIKKNLFVDARVSHAIVELRGHPFPKLEYPNSRPNRNHIHNVLLTEARKDLRLNADREGTKQ